MLLMRLRYSRYINGEPWVYEIFFDSTHIKGRPTCQNIGKSILEIFDYKRTNVAKCRTQAYDGDKFHVQLVSLRKQQALKEYTQCRTHEVNLTINFACENQPIQKFMDNLTTICYYFDNSPKRQQYL